MIELVEAIAGRPWAIRAEIAAHVRSVVAREGIAGLRALAQVKADVHAFDGRIRRPSVPSPEKERAVAVIPVIGTLTQRVEVISSLQVTRSTEDIVAEVEEAARDRKIGAIVLEFDSPGGVAMGLPEAWQAIRDVRKAKPVVAAISSVAASAGYYLATAADEIWVTPSGQVGSIGVYALHVDISGALEKIGESWEFVSAGKYKLERNPAKPLGKEAREAIQAHVDEYYNQFLAAVSRGRRVAERDVRYGFGEGRMVQAFAAVREGMADQVGTLRHAIQRARELAAEEQQEFGARQLRATRESAEDAQILARRNTAARKLAMMDGRVSSRGLTPKQEADLARFREEDRRAEEIRRRLWESA